MINNSNIEYTKHVLLVDFNFLTATCVSDLFDFQKHRLHLMAITTTYVIQIGIVVFFLFLVLISLFGLHRISTGSNQHAMFMWILSHQMLISYLNVSEIVLSYIGNFANDLPDLCIYIVANGLLICQALNLFLCGVHNYMLGGLLLMQLHRISNPFSTLTRSTQPVHIFCSLLDLFGALSSLVRLFSGHAFVCKYAGKLFGVGVTNNNNMWASFAVGLLNVCLPWSIAIFCTTRLCRTSLSMPVRTHCSGSQKTSQSPGNRIQRNTMHLLILMLVNTIFMWSLLMPIYQLVDDYQLREVQHQHRYIQDLLFKATTNIGNFMSIAIVFYMLISSDSHFRRLFLRIGPRFSISEARNISQFTRMSGYVHSSSISQRLTNTFESDIFDQDLSNVPEPSLPESKSKNSIFNRMNPNNIPHFITTNSIGPTQSPPTINILEGRIRFHVA